MLLPFRWLLYGTATVAAVIEKGTHKHPKIQRKLRRLAQWSEAVAPPRLNVVIAGIAIPPLRPSVVSGTLTITRHVAVYNKGPFATSISLADFTGIDVSPFALDDAIKPSASLAQTGELVAAFDLLEEEYLAIAHLLPPRVRARPSEKQRVTFLV